MRLRFYLWLLAFFLVHNLPFGWLVRLTPLREQIVIFQLVKTCDSLGVQPHELLSDLNGTLKKIGNRDR